MLNKHHRLYSTLGSLLMTTNVKKEVAAYAAISKLLIARVPALSTVKTHSEEPILPNGLINDIMYDINTCGAINKDLFKDVLRRHVMIKVSMFTSMDSMDSATTYDDIFGVKNILGGHTEAIEEYFDHYKEVYNTLVLMNPTFKG